MTVTVPVSVCVCVCVNLQVSISTCAPRPASSLTDALGGCGARLEALVALAAVAAHRVDAAPVLTDARLGATFIQVCQTVGRGRGG